MNSNSEYSEEYRFLPLPHISRRYKDAFLSAFICGFWTHLYLITNMHSGDDVNMAYYSPIEHSIKNLIVNGASSGRWLTGVADRAITWFGTPVTAGLMIVVMFALMAVLIVDIFEIQSRFNVILASALFSIFPAALAFYELMGVGYPIAFLLSIIAMKLTLVNKKRIWIVGGALLAISLAVFPVTISFFGILFLIRTLKALVAEEKLDTMKVNMEAMRAFLTTVIGCGICLGGAIFLMRIFSLEASSYQGGSEALTGAFLYKLPENIWATIKAACQLSYSRMHILPQLRFLCIACYLIMAISIVYLWWTNKVYKDVIRTILSGICICLVPFALCTMSIVSSQFSYQDQHRMPWSVLLIGSIVFSESAVRYLVKKKKIVRWLYGGALAVFIFMCYGFFLFSNIKQYNQQFIMEKDQALAIRILAALEQTDGFSYDKPVYFLALQEEDDGKKATSPLINDYEWYRSMAYPGSAETNFLWYKDQNIKSHMQRLEGIRLQGVSQKVGWEIEESDLREQYKELKAGEFAITEYKDTGIYVVIVPIILAPEY